MKAQDHSKQNFKFPNDRKINVGVLLYEGVEIVDTRSPIDVFIKANNLNGKYNIYTVSATSNKNVIMDGKVFTVQSKYSIDDIY